MKTSRSRSLFRVLAVAALFVAARLPAQPFGQWDFNSGNLVATVGADLGFADGPGGPTDLGTTFGSTTLLGIPDIAGSPASVMSFPAATNSQGFLMPTPPGNGGGGFAVNQYTLIMDIFYPAASGSSVRPLFRCYALGGTEQYFVINAAGAVGPAVLGAGGINGPFVGGLQPNTWYRLGIVVNAGVSAHVYTNGVEMGSFTGGAVDGFLAMDANSLALILGTSGTNAAAGYVNSIQLRDVALTGGQMSALGGPIAAGIPQDIPAIPTFLSSWTPSGSASRTVTDLGAVINPGDASVDLSSISLKLNSAAQTGVAVTTNATTGLITVLKTAAGPLAAGTTYTLEVSLTNSQVGALSFSKQFKPALLFEDFEMLTLGTNIDEALLVELNNNQPTIWTNAWTRTPPAGWVLDSSGVPGFGGDITNDGVSEWAGWAFASKTFWGVETDNQDRQLFTLGQGTVAVADSDEWDDAAHPRTSYYSTFLTTPPINITGRAANSIFMKFDSSWRPEALDDWGELGETNNQTALITVSYDGEAPIEVLRWDSREGNPNFHTDTPNEAVSILLNNPAGKSSLVVTFAYLYAANDWWWAFDNVEVNVGDIPSSLVQQIPTPDSSTAGPRPNVGITIVPGTTTINVGSILFLLDGSSVPVTVITNAQGQLVVSGRATGVLPKLSMHTNTFIYSDSLNGFQTNSWKFTVADYDEVVLGTPVWREEFNGVMEANFPAGWSATNRTTAVRTNFDLGDVGSAAYENFVLINAGRSILNARRHNVRPTTLNGQAVDALMTGNVVYGESDRRGGEQVQVLFSPVINLTGISNVKLAFNSIYEQNQDSMGAVEYSIDGGATWLPVLYMIKSLEGDDIISGDPVATLGTARTDQAWDLAYNAFIGATVDASFGPYISGRVDDDQVESKRIEVHELPMAANQSNVRLRFTHTGTGSWYFGIDDVGLYGDGQVNTAPEMANQPQGGTAAANTAFQIVGGVSPYATRPLNFQWTRNGTNVAGATAQSYNIASMQPDDAGDYRLIVGNVSGSVTSDVATVNYLLPEPPMIGSDLTNSAVTADLIAGFAISATGTAPLSYQWYFNDAAIAGATTSTLNLQHVDATNGGTYYVVVTNNYGAKTSLVATLTVLPASPVEITGQWDFDCGTFQATVGSDLIPFNATVAADSSFGDSTSLSIANIGGVPAQVLYLNPSVGNWGGYRMYHGAAPNGGGQYVNRYTIIYDVYYARAGQWKSFLQTGTGNSNDGDIFVNPGNGIGISSVYQGTVNATTWHRIAFVFDLPYSTLKKYIDGALVGTQTLGEGLDGRWSLDPSALLFGDEDGDHDPTYVNSVQFRNGIMTDAQIAALGGATTATGIPGATPRICSATRNGNTLTITWPGQPDVRLLKATSLTNPVWMEVAGSLGASSANDTITADPAYYRLGRQ